MRRVSRRLWFGEREGCPAPAIGAVAIPARRAIAPFERSLRRVPAHPAIGPAVEDERRVVARCGDPREAGAEPCLQLRTEHAAAAIGEPDTARNVEMR